MGGLKSLESRGCAAGAGLPSHGPGAGRIASEADGR